MYEEFNNSIYNPSFSLESNSPEINIDIISSDKENGFLQNTSEKSFENQKNENSNNSKEISKSIKEKIEIKYKFPKSNSILMEKIKEKIALYGEENCKELIKLKNKEKEELYQTYIKLIEKKNQTFLLNDITNNLEDLRERLKKLKNEKAYIFFYQRNLFFQEYNQIISKIQKTYFKKKNKKYIEIQKEVDSDFNVFFSLNKFAIFKTWDIFEKILSKDNLNKENILKELKNINENDLFNKYIENLSTIDDLIKDNIQKEKDYFIKCREKIINKINEK